MSVASHTCTHSSSQYLTLNCWAARSTAHHTPSWTLWGRRHVSGQPCVHTLQQPVPHPELLGCTFHCTCLHTFQDTARQAHSHPVVGCTQTVIWQVTCYQKAGDQGSDPHIREARCTSSACTSARQPMDLHLSQTGCMLLDFLHQMLGMLRAASRVCTLMTAAQPTGVDIMLHAHFSSSHACRNSVQVPAYTRLQNHAWQTPRGTQTHGLAHQPSLVQTQPRVP
jgi:hypothetical protein